MDRHGSGKRPGTGTNKTGTELLVSVKCRKFIGYLNEGIPKKGAEKNIWAKNGIIKMNLETVSHAGASRFLILAKSHEANRIKQPNGGRGEGHWAGLEDKRNTRDVLMMKPDTRKPLGKP
jgi:hypothetical protein